MAVPDSVKALDGKILPLIRSDENFGTEDVD